jgi:hypothetical protein
MLNEIVIQQLRLTPNFQVTFDTHIKTFVKIRKKAYGRLGRVRERWRVKVGYRRVKVRVRRGCLLKFTFTDTDGKKVVWWG